jgi:hypothetical protein
MKPDRAASATKARPLDAPMRSNVRFLMRAPFSSFVTADEMATI